MHLGIDAGRSYFCLHLTSVMARQLVVEITKIETQVVAAARDCFHVAVKLSLQSSCA